MTGRVARWRRIGLFSGVVAACGVTVALQAVDSAPALNETPQNAEVVEAVTEVVAPIVVTSAVPAQQCGHAGCCGEHGLMCSMYAPGYKPAREHVDTFVVQNPAWKWPQPGGLGTPVAITYSYSNLLNGGMGVSNANLKSAVEQALALWAAEAPLVFTEVTDSGPLPSTPDPSYTPNGSPMLRFGHHFIDGGSGVLAHAFFPFDPTQTSNGLAGDLHFDSGENWSVNPNVGIDFLEVCLHEIGHAIGLGHEPSPPAGAVAIMNPFYGGRFSGLGTGFLLQDDKNGIKSIYDTVTGGPCPVEQISTLNLPFKLTKLIGQPADRDEFLTELRSFRDDVLMKTPAGRDLVRLYYRHSDEMGRHLMQNPQLGVEVLGVIMTALPALAVNDADAAVVDMSMESYERGLEVLAELKKQASEGLAADLTRVEELLVQHSTLTDLGVSLNLDPADLMPANPIAKVPFTIESGSR